MNPIDNILKNTRIRTKILVATIMVVSFFMGLSLYQSLAIHKKTVMKEVASSSDHLLESIYSGIKFPMSVGDSNTIREQMKDIKHHMEGVQVYIFDFQNMIMYASEDERIYKSMATYLYENKSRDALAESLLTGQAPDISFPKSGHQYYRDSQLQVIHHILLPLSLSLMKTLAIIAMALPGKFWVL